MSQKSCELTLRAYLELCPCDVLVFKFFVLDFLLSRERYKLAVLEQAVHVYTSEFQRFLKFIR